MCDPCGKLSGSETEGMRTGEEGTTASQARRGLTQTAVAATLREVRPVLIVEVGTLSP